MLSSLKRTIARSGRETQIQFFFHIQARHRKRKNFIARLVAEGGVCTSHEEKAKVVDEFYGSLLGTRQDREHSIDLQALGIPTHNLTILDSPFSEKEVWETIKQLPSDKAPGPDGFMGRFYKAC
jgi:hypothetical protein